MAPTPVRTVDSSVSRDLAESLAARIANGEHPKDLARKLAPNDPTKRRRLYSRFRAIALRDARVATYVSEEAQLAAMVALVPATKAMAGRAARGRVDAGKLILEVTGYHNPRVQHEHSGDIKISLTIPRPDREPKAIEGTVVDADVVEDGASS